MVLLRKIFLLDKNNLSEIRYFKQLQIQWPQYQ